MGFADSVRASSDKISNQINAKIIEIATDLFVGVVDGTPVLKAVLKDNWYTAEGVNITDTSYNPTSSSGGMSSLARIESLTALTTFIGKDSEISLSNSTPYAYRAEYVGWPKEDNPRWTGNVKAYAMVRIALNNTAAKYRTT